MILCYLFKISISLNKVAADAQFEFLYLPLYTLGGSAQLILFHLFIIIIRKKKHTNENADIMN